MTIIVDRRAFVIIVNVIVQVASKCKSWNVKEQSDQPSTFLHLASGRLGARISPYMILLILRKG